jgi:hypothetical protein
VRVSGYELESWRVGELEEKDKKAAVAKQCGFPET